MTGPEVWLVKVTRVHGHGERSVGDGRRLLAETSGSPNGGATRLVVSVSTTSRA